MRLAPETSREKVNPHRQGEPYPMDPEVRKVAETHRAADLEAYRCACERFERLTFRYGL